LCLLDTETKGSHHFATVVGYLLRTPRGHPDPVDAEFLGVPVEALTDLLFDDVSQGAASAGEGHLNDESVVVDIPQQVVNKAEIDDVDAEFRVDDLFETVDELVVALVREGNAVH